MLYKLCLVASLVGAASAAAVSRPELAKVNGLRGGAYPAPKAGYDALTAKGAAVSKAETSKNLVSAMLSGGYVSFGGVVALSIAGNLPGIAESNPGLQKLIFSLIFPIALLNVIVTGTQLFNGNTASVATAVYEGLVEPAALVRNWVLTYSGNAIGALLFCQAFCYTGLNTGGVAKMITKMAEGKCTASFGQQVLKGVFANWLVCLACFMAYSETTLVGKIAPIYICVSALVMCGFEHAISNIFLLSLGAKAGASISATDIITKNLVPVTIGNIIAGAGIFGAGYSFLYGKLGGNKKD
jgi:formate/nitrite transporter